MATYIQRSTPTGLNNDGDYDSFPAACKRHDGDFVVVYRGNVNSHLLTDGGDILMQVSSDSGATWGAETTIQTAPSGRDLRDVGLLKLAATDKLLLTYTSVLVASGHTTTNLIRTVVSDDDGATWNAPVDIDWSGQGDDRAIVTCSPIQLASGRILLAVRVRDTSETYDNTEIYYSDDNAATWTHLSRAGDGDTSGRMLAEPSLALLPNGDVLCLMRNNSPEETWYATSSDSGATWTTPAKAFSSSGAPRCLVHDGKVYVFGRSTAEPKDYCWVFWTTPDRLDDGEWFGAWQFRQTAAGYILNYGHFLADGDTLYAVWSEGQSHTDSDLYFSRIADTIDDGDTLIADSFNRADSALIGGCDGGAAGVVAAGRQWGFTGSGARIQSNKIENNSATAGDNAAFYLIRTGLQNFDISVKLTPTTSFASLKFRLNTARTSGYFVQLRGVDGHFRLYRLDSGTSTQINTSSQGITGGTEYTVRVRGVGGRFACYLNGSLIFTGSDSTYSGYDQTAFELELDNIAGNTCKADDFAVSAAIGSVPIFAHHYRQLAMAQR